MGTGNKTVQSRRNVRTSARKTPERRGGYRAGSGRKKGSPNVRIRNAQAEHIEAVMKKLEGEYGFSLVELHMRTAYDTKDEWLCAKISGELLTAWFKPNVGQRIPANGEATEEPGNGEDLGQKGLPPRKPDPAKKVA